MIKALFTLPILLISQFSSCSATNSNSGTNVSLPAYRMVLTVAETRGDYQLTTQEPIAKGGAGTLNLDSCEPSHSAGFQSGYAAKLDGKPTSGGLLNPTPTVVPEINSEAWAFDTPDSASAAYNAAVDCMIHDHLLTRVVPAKVDFTDTAEQITVDTSTSEDSRFLWADRNVLAMLSSRSGSFGDPSQAQAWAKAQDAFYQ